MSIKSNIYQNCVQSHEPLLSIHHELFIASIPIAMCMFYMKEYLLIDDTPVPDVYPPELAESIALTVQTVDIQAIPTSAPVLDEMLIFLYPKCVYEGNLRAVGH